MSKSSGVKRKLQETGDGQAAEPQGWIKTSGDLLSADLDELFSGIVEDIRSGRHPEVVRRSAPLDQLREKQIAACDRHRKEQIKNINQLYEYEVEEAASQFERACGELREQLVSEVVDECTKLRNLQRKLQDQASRSADPKSSAAARALRSSQADLASTEPKTRIRKRTKEPQTQLNKVIPESCRRADFLEIVRDLQSQAKSWEKQFGTESKNVVVSEDSCSLSIEGTSFFLGDQVSLTSHLSGETFIGMLSLISPKEAVVRMGNGVRISFQIIQLRTNRVTLSLTSQ